MATEADRQQEIDEVFAMMSLASPHARAAFVGVPEVPAAQFTVVISNSSNPF